MSRHVIVAFEGVFVMMRPVGHELAKMPLQIATYFRTHILVDRKRCRGVLNEEMQHASFDLAQFRQLAHDFIGDDMKAPATRLKSDDALNPGHKEIMAANELCT